MQIRIPTGDCRAAIAAAILAHTKDIEDSRVRLKDECYDRLLDGARHNGLQITDRIKDEMREMAERDVEHAMHRHPGAETIEVLKNFNDMLDHHDEMVVTIDDQDFNILKAHLPARTNANDTPVAA